MTQAAPPAASPPDLLGYLLGLVASRPPRFLLLSGRVGAGKSSLLRTLYRQHQGPSICVLYQQPGGAPTGAPGVDTHEATLLIADPARGHDPPGAADVAEPNAGAPVATDAAAANFLGPLRGAVARLSSSPGGAIFVDAWDRDSESFARGLLARPGDAETVRLPTDDFGAMQSALLSLRLGIVLAVVPELANPLLSLADVLIGLREEDRQGARVRILTLEKVRGAPPLAREHLYTLDGTAFRAFPALPRGFLPPSAVPDPEPSPEPGTIWPGSASYASAFGRLRHGAYSALSLRPGTPDTLALGIVEPIVAQVLHSGGRVVWMPAPSMRPSRVIAALRDRVPPDWLRERLRILSASGDDPSLGELASVVLPLRREIGSGGDLRAATSPGVGPIFPEAYHFLRMAPDASSALYVLSVEGLKASVATIGRPLDPSTLPAVLASYARLPRFHGFGYGSADDPLAQAILSMMDSTIEMQLVCGRPVLVGLHPKTPTFVLDWPGPDGRYALLPCT